MPRQIDYEWCAETVQVVDTDEHQAGDVVDHFHNAKPAAVFDYIRRWPLDASKRYDVVLVRGGNGGGRSWCYVAPDGTLPEFFADARGKQTPHAVPARERRAYDEARAALKL